jgi:2-keto-4-pentenoate hydratase/2-oxohepta-3-ene-1,7-dioic acid hydratase in catechol pathway
MKLTSFDAGDGPEAGIVVGDYVVGFRAASGGKMPRRIIDLLGDGDGVREVAGLADDTLRGEIAPEKMIPLEEVRLLPPVPRPGKIVCLGLNYSDHAAESGAEIPDEPVVFCKATTAVIGPGEPIVLPEVSEKVDYEVELAAVIGRAVKNVSAEKAIDHVAGYTVMCDVSARDYQHEKPGGQWYLGKSFDTFCPLGPWIVTREEIPEPHELDLRCEVSGEVLQSSNTSQMIFRLPQIIAYLSRVFTLEVGDVVATGTPHGVGAARTPPRFLRSGDTVRCHVEGIGMLQNPVK